METAKLTQGKCARTKIMRIHTNMAYCNAYSYEYALFSVYVPLSCAWSCAGCKTACC